MEALEAPRPSQYKGYYRAGGGLGTCGIWIAQQPTWFIHNITSHSYKYIYVPKKTVFFCIQVILCLVVVFDTCLLNIAKIHQQYAVGFVSVGQHSESQFACSELGSLLHLLQLFCWWISCCSEGETGAHCTIPGCLLHPSNNLSSTIAAKVWPTAMTLIATLSYKRTHFTIVPQFVAVSLALRQCASDANCTIAAREYSHSASQHCCWSDSHTSVPHEALWREKEGKTW